MPCARHTIPLAVHIGLLSGRTMNRISQGVVTAWLRLGTRFLPFADAATPDLPLSRLLRLSLFQVSVGMALVLLIGTLNRVMIVELDVPASLVGIMISLPLIFAPFRALIGFRSDTHRSELGWKRVPFIWQGTHGAIRRPRHHAVCVAGALRRRQCRPARRHGSAVAAPASRSCSSAPACTPRRRSAWRLATDLAPTESQPKVVGLMYVMLLFGMIASALGFRRAAREFQPRRLDPGDSGRGAGHDDSQHGRAVEAGGRAAEPPRRNRSRAAQLSANRGRASSAADQALRRLIAVGLGTMAFSMEDVLLEPYGGQILHLAVGDTTKLTATLGGRRPVRVRAGVTGSQPRRRSVPDGRLRRLWSAFRRFWP